MLTLSSSGFDAGSAGEWSCRALAGPTAERKTAKDYGRASTLLPVFSARNIGVLSEDYRNLHAVPNRDVRSRLSSTLNLCGGGASRITARCFHVREAFRSGSGVEVPLAPLRREVH